MSTGNGALIQLVAFGIQDVYLVTDPEITFFKSVYRRHTNFSIEQIPQKFDNIPNFGRKSTTTIGRLGDLINNCILEITIPTVSPIANISGTTAQITDLIETVSNGEINNVTILDDGDGYSIITQPLLTIVNANGVNADIVVTLNAGVVDSIIINNGGSLYKLANTVISLSGGNPITPAILDITTISNGVITGVSILDGGSGYTSIPTVSISNLNIGIGTGATATPVISNIDGSIDSITVTNSGKCYVSDTTLILIDDQGIPPITPATLEINSLDIFNIRTGMIRSLNILNPGFEYTTPPIITIENANGQFATVEVTIDGFGSIDSVTIVNGGTNYKLENTTIVLGGPATFTFVGVLSISNIVNGVITGVNIDNVGLGYSETPTVTVSNIETGIGENATAVAVIDATGSVTQVNILNPGINYKLNTTIVYVTQGSPSAEAFVEVQQIDDERCDMISSIPLNLSLLGENYIIPPKVVITDTSTGTGAIVDVSIINGEISEFTIINPGENYNPATTLVEFVGGIPVNTFSWSKKLAHVIAKNVEIQIGGQLIDKHYTEWFNILA